MSTRKRTAAEWPRMKVRGGRRRYGHRNIGAALEGLAAATAWMSENFDALLDVWQRHVAAGMRAALAIERNSEEEQATRALGGELAVSPALVDDVIAQTLRHTPAEPTDWAIARANLSALAAMTKI